MPPWARRTLTLAHHGRCICLPTPQITDGKANRLYQKTQATNGKFAFTSDDYDTFNICFNQKPINGQRLLAM